MKNREIHPYLNDGNIKGATKLILGSFPVYACTEPDNDEKQLIRNTEGTVRFFYGSCKSRFWGFYHQYIDASVTVPVKKEIALESLCKNKIAVSDTIKSCIRKGKSALDVDLSKKEYNTEMIQNMIKSGIAKILCTSKGVLADLNEKILLHLKGISIDKQMTMQFTEEILQHLSGSIENIKKPFCRVYRFNGNFIYVLSIPSPGSPQRKPESFGWVTGSKIVYVNEFLKYAFNWIKK